MSFSLTPALADESDDNPQTTIAVLNLQIPGFGCCPFIFLFFFFLLSRLIYSFAALFEALQPVFWRTLSTSLLSLGTLKGSGCNAFSL